jgi:hypothetical protein
VKLGTWTAGQGGNVVTVQIDQHSGYNATTSQNQQVYIYMKTSNGSSVDLNGFAGDSSFWTEGLNQAIQSGYVVWEANAAGVSASAYTLYVYMGAFTNASQYTVTTRGGTWANVGTLTSPSGTTPSSTILLSENRFVVNNILTVGGAASGNVLIGTYTDVGYKLDVSGTGRFSGQVTISSTSGDVIGARNTLYLKNSASTGNQSNGIVFGSAGTAASWIILNDINADGSTINRLDIFNGANNRFTIESTGAVKLGAYGSGSFTGTAAYNLGVDASGNIIELPGGVVDGSGTANYVAKWSDANTLTNSIVYDNGTNVGIGTTNPLAKLDVAGNARFGGTDAYNSITINNNSNTGGGGILVQRNGVNNAYLGALGWYQGTSNSGAVIGTDNSSYPIVFYTNVEQMRITGGGNVLIGTTTDNGDKLQVAGQTTINGSLYLRGGSRSIVGDGGDLLIDTENVAGRDILLQTQSGQNVGIGNSTPRARLVVGTQSSGTSGSGVAQDNSIIGIFGGANGAGRVTALTLTNSAASEVGNDATLSFIVAGNYSATGLISTVLQNTSTAGTDMIFSLYNNSMGEKMRINSIGNVSIGNPSAQPNGASAVLDIGNGSGGTINLRDTNTGIAAEGFNQIYGGDNYMYLYAGGSGASSQMQFYVNDGEKMRISTSGNILIGTSTDAGYKLRVNGNVLTYNGIFNQGDHGSSWIQNHLTAANNGAGTGAVQLRMWCSEPGITWDWAGFGYNVNNDGVGPYGFSRTNSNFGQAYMRFSTDGSLYFYNTTTSNVRTTTMTLSPTGNVGIGTTSPGSRLNVTDGFIRVNGADTDQYFFEGVRTGVSTTLRIYDNSSVPFYDSHGTMIFRANQNGGSGGYIGLQGGNVGIGTTSPSQLLHITGTNAANNGITIQNTNASGNSQVRFLNTSGTERAAITYVNSADAVYFYLATAGNILNLVGANVGISATSPITRLTLGGYSGSRLPYIDGTTKTFDAAGITVTSSNTSNTGIGGGIDLTNNVHSVGSYSPIISFSALSQSGGYNNSYAAIWGILAGAGGDANWNVGHIAFGTASSYGISEKMRLTGNGHLLIGTTNDNGNKLRVNGDVFVDGIYRVPATSYFISGSAGYRFNNSTDAFNNVIIYDNGNMYVRGNTLLGTTTNAGYRLDVNGTTRVQGDLITTGRQYVQSTPVNIKLPWFSLSANGTAVSDAQASDGTAAVRYSASGNDTFFYGPYQAIDAGSYVARFRIKVASNASASYIGYIDVVGTNISGEAVSLRPNMLPTGGDYYYIDVPFNSNNDSSVFETRWIGWVTGITDTYIDHVLIVPQSKTNNVYVTDGDNYTVYEAQLPRLFIQNGTGRIGVGTTNPNQRLSVEGGSIQMNADNAAANYYLFLNKKNGQDGGILFNRDNGNDWQLTNVTNNGNLLFYSYGTATEAITFTKATGNVLIGTTTDAGYKLAVNGSARVSSTSNLAMFIKTSSSFGAGISFEDSTTGGNDVVHAGAIGSGFYITTGFSERFRIDSNGFVGIAATPSSSWTLAIDSLFGADGALKTTGSVNINSGSLGVNVAPSATAGRIDASNDIVAFSTSDQRLKENITPIANALDKVKSLTGVEFDWKEETKHVHGYEGHDVGVIAQEVQAVLPEAIRTNDTGYLSVRYEKMIALLIEANKELAARVEELEKKLK